MARKAEDNKSCCWTCEWIAEFNWICCNGDSKYKAESPPMHDPDFRCEEYASEKGTQ
jgi:hypothetical protein